MDDMPKSEKTTPDVVEMETNKTTKSGVILRPQPTNDPNEPLVSNSRAYLSMNLNLRVSDLDRQNWPQREKYATYLTICWFTFLALTNGSAFTVAVVPIMKQFQKTPTEASYLGEFCSFKH